MSGTQNNSQRSMSEENQFAGGDLVFVYSNRFEPWPGKITKVFNKGGEKSYFVDFYNHNTYITVSALSLQLVDSYLVL